QSVSAARPMTTSAWGSASCTAPVTLWMSASGGKCVTSATPSSCTPCAPAANSAARAASRCWLGMTRIESQPIGNRESGIERPSPVEHRAQHPSLGAERLLHPRPETFLAGLRGLLRFSQLPQQGLLVARHRVGRPELHSNVEIADARRVHARQATPAYVEDLSALRPRRDAQRDRVRNRGNIDVIA